MTIKRCYPVLIGASVAENQLINIMSVDGSKTESGITITDNRDGSYTVSGTATDNVFQALNAVTVISGHKYFWRGTPKGGSLSTYRSYITANVTGNYDFGDGTIYNATGTGTSYVVALYVTNGTTISTPITFRPQLTDLTAELGSTIADYIYSLESATAGSGIAWLRSYGFLGGYVPYNAGSLESVEVTEKKVVGFNQWDEEWELGVYDVSTGQPVASNFSIRGKNRFAVVPNTSYYTNNNLVRRLYYDADDNFISVKGGIGLDTTPSNCAYMRIYLADVYGTTYNHDICINLSNPVRNGEYEPYKSITYQLGSDTLRGIFKLDANNNLYADGDRKEADGTITRKYGVVDLGALKWTYLSNNGFMYAPYGTKANNAFGRLYVCSHPKFVYQNLSANTAWRDGTEGLWVEPDAISSTSRIYAKDSAYTDAAAFKAAMSGVMLVYELATPTTEQGDPFPSPQIVYPYGTEEFVTETGVPVGHETKYQL